MVWVGFACVTVGAAVGLIYFPAYWRSKAAFLRDNRPPWFPWVQQGWLRYLRGYSGGVIFLSVLAVLYLPLALIQTDNWPKWLAGVVAIVFFGSMALALVLFVAGRPEALVPPALRRSQTKGTLD